MLSPEQLQRAAADSGFQIESFEKVHMLVRLLNAVRAHPFLGPRMALKGGTALNLFVLDLPRLSVDIDLNYVGSRDRATMLADRPRIEEALQQVAGRSGLTVKRVPIEHAGGKWRLSYTTALGRQGSIEVDVNFMLRTPLWPVAPRDSRPVGGETATQILVLDEHELAAGKLFAAADASVTITSSHVDAAWKVAHYSRRVAAMVLSKLAAQNMRDAEARVRRAMGRVAKQGEPFHRRDVWQRIKGRHGLDAEMFNRVWEALVRAGDISEQKEGSGTFTYSGGES